MTTLLIIIGAVLLVLGIFIYLKNEQHEEETTHVVPTITTPEAEHEPMVMDEPTVVVNNIVVEPTQQEKPKPAPRPAVKKAAPKKKAPAKPAPKPAAKPANNSTKK